jgi:fructose-1,6-bisphosphatase/sedoheptulose 1,7-bisphosphatase-like protein
VPHLPSTSLTLQRSLMLNLEYITLALKMHKRFHAMVAKAREQGALTPLVPDDVLVYTLYSRACDPTVDFLLRDKRMSHEQIVAAMVHATLGGFLSEQARSAGLQQAEQVSIESENEKSLKPFWFQAFALIAAIALITAPVLSQYR